MSNEPDTGHVSRFPTPQRLRQIIEWNENEGGRRSYAPCASTQVPYKMPDGRQIIMHTTACNEESVIRVNYRDPEGGLSFAEVCINDDACHLWPRFSDEARGRPFEVD